MATEKQQQRQQQKSEAAKSKAESGAVVILANGLPQSAQSRRRSNQHKSICVHTSHGRVNEVVVDGLVVLSVKGLTGPSLHYVW